MMENQMLDVSMDVMSRGSVVIDGNSPHTAINSLVQSCPFDLNDQNLIMAVPLPSTIQVPINGDVTNCTGIVVPNTFITGHRRNIVRDASFSCLSATGNSEFKEPPISAASVATFLAARDGLQENLNNLAISMPPMYSSEVLADYISNSFSSTSNYRLAPSMNCGYEEVLGNNVSSQWDIHKYPAPSEIGGKTSVRTECQPYSSLGNIDPSEWISSNGASVATVDHSYRSSKFGNELSLSLATSQPSVIGGINIPGQCSEMTCSGMAHNETMFPSERTSCSSEELSLSFGSDGPPQCSQVILGSRYLCVVQEILAQIANYSLENLDLHASYSIAGVNTPFSSNCPAVRGTSPSSPQLKDRLEVQMDSSLQKRAVERKKAKLLALLQMVDDRYNQCLDEIHTVISAFHAATELDPQIHARFALHTISLLYKNLRERIGNHFLAMGAEFNPACFRENERSFETSFIQKQWALQQLKKKDQQLWRPQRGLPERSVSVLRAWMFQNFLHPYPKDAEKHLLAVKSGLTRNQVSNWFINARVRLWKPMIEEMYSEMNRRKTHRNDQSTDTSNHRSHSSTNSQRYNVN
ncbi:hypothetical protein FNV43_RR12702 [Rhamnella rubrinervis]|uniref:Homeobox domain-containing protein n=1 Tax=Rhamnella rubrinervis TaxID=2594499 RepID=A0A8K0MIR3_9ROSA|nr:hypothetical protein FNV43_RR12702 [Rhamnella rubrinervis]